MQKSRKKLKVPKPIPLKKWLDDNGHSQVWLYRRLITYFDGDFPEISYTTYNRIIRGERDPEPTMVVPVAEILGQNPDWVRQKLKLK